LSQSQERAAIPTDPKDLIIAVDYDGTITDHAKMIVSDHTTFLSPPPPASGVMEFLQGLIAAGSTVIVMSARLTPHWQINKPWAQEAYERRPYRSKPEAIKSLQFDLIEKYMLKYDLRYTALRAGRPMAHFYIDDRSYNPITQPWQDILNIILKT